MVEVVGDSSRGDDFALVRLEVEGERIVASEASGLDRALDGLTLLEAAAVGGETLVVDALANALAQVFRAAPRPDRVAVAMSGGVDSAVALLRAAPNAIGVTLRLWVDPYGPDGERACCSPSAVLAARDTCHALGIPHVTLDLREEFRRAVVAPFVAAYGRGQTPNPCIRCNGSFRFAELLAFAARAGAARLATGHYARVVERGGTLLLARAVDEQKDQTYMLAKLDPRFLTQLWFPLGEQTKGETRAEAERAGLRAARRPESQEACFLAGGDYRDFLARHGVASSPGAIVDEAGNEVGSHSGLWRFTPGQRRGIGVAAREPLYTLRGNPKTNTLVVGPRAALAVSTIRASGRLYAPVARADAKLRYRAPATPATVSPADGGFVLHLDHAVDAAAPGQAAVLYDADAVVGFGTIVDAA